MKGYKGNVHIAFGKPLQGDFENSDQVARQIDRQIHQFYKLWPTNLFAYDYLEGTDRFASSYQDFDSEAFLYRFKGAREDVRLYALNAYANPVRSFLATGMVLYFSCCCSSCRPRQEELALLDLQTNVAIHVHPAEGRKEQLLTLVFSLTGEPTEKQVHIVAGNQKSSWVVKARSDERSTYTIGPLSMGSDVLLPKGQWSLSILSSDGQTLEEVFVVDYPTFRNWLRMIERPYTHPCDNRSLLSLMKRRACFTTSWNPTLISSSMRQPNQPWCM